MISIRITCDAGSMAFQSNNPALERQATELMRAMKNQEPTPEVREQIKEKLPALLRDTATQIETGVSET